MTMTKKQKDWETLPLFTDWADYERLTPEALEALLQSWDQQIQAVRSQMSHAEIIMGRSGRAKRVSLSTGHCALIRQRLIDHAGPSKEVLERWGQSQEGLQQVSETPTHTHQL